MLTFSKSCISLSLGLRLTPAISSSASFSTRCRAKSVNSFALPQQRPPLPKKVPFTVSAHGMTWQDPFYWMRNTTDPDFVEYLKQENSYAQAFMADTKNIQRTLVSEMKSRMPEKFSTPPERWGPWFVHFSVTLSLYFFASRFFFINLLILLWIPPILC